MRREKKWGQWVVTTILVVAIARYTGLASLPPGVGKLLAYYGTALLPVAFLLLKDAYAAQNANVRARLEWERWERGEDGREIVHGWPKVIPQPFPTDKEQQLKVFMHWAMWLHGVMGADKKGILALLREGNQTYSSTPLSERELESIVDYAVGQEHVWSLSHLPFGSGEVWSTPLLSLFIGPCMVLFACVILSYIVQFLGIAIGSEALRAFRFL